MDRTGLSLVRFVASRYRQLQGLGRVVDAVSLLLLWSLLTTEPANGGPLWFAGAMVVWASLTLWGLARVGRYYRERFGRTASTADSTAGSGSAGEVMLFADQASAQQRQFAHGAGHAFAEPESAREIFSGVVDGLK